MTQPEFEAYFDAFARIAENHQREAVHLQDSGDYDAARVAAAKHSATAGMLNLFLRLVQLSEPCEGITPWLQTRLDRLQPDSPEPPPPLYP